MSEKSFYTLPDSLLGALAAVESIENAVALLNSPTGCKFVPSFIVENQDLRKVSVDPFEYEEEFYFGQSRIPCTYLDEIDFVHGTEEKLIRALQTLDNKGFKLIAIINGPATSLIGDDLEGIVQKASISADVITIEATSFDGSAPVGYNAVMNKVIKKFTPHTTTIIPKSVTITGINTLTFNWADNVRQLKEDLALAGIDVTTSIGAGFQIEELSKAVQSAVCVSANEVYGTEICSLLASYNPSMIVPEEMLLPIGIQATETWLTTVCELAKGELHPLNAVIKRTRQTLFDHISRFNSRMGFPEGLTCFISADADIAAPLLLYLNDYLGLYPLGIYVNQRSPYAEAFIQHYIKEKQLNTPLHYSPSPQEEASILKNIQPDLLFGSSHDLALFVGSTNKFPAFVPVSYPSFGTINMTHKPIMGIGGTLYLTELILNQVLKLSRTAVI